MKHPDFFDCCPTAKFLTYVNNLFDMLNSRLPWATGFKAPLKSENEEFIKLYIDAGISYLEKLKDITGKPLLQTTRKTPFLGLIISLHSIKGMFYDYIKGEKLRYMLTYKCSQDHLELFFCSIR